MSINPSRSGRSAFLRLLPSLMLFPTSGLSRARKLLFYIILQKVSPFFKTSQHPSANKSTAESRALSSLHEHPQEAFFLFFFSAPEVLLNMCRVS